MCYVLLGGHFGLVGDRLWSGVASTAMPVVQLSWRPGPALQMSLCSE